MGSLCCDFIWNTKKINFCQNFLPIIQNGFTLVRTPSSRPIEKFWTNTHNLGSSSRSFWNVSYIKFNWRILPQICSNLQSQVQTPTTRDELKSLAIDKFVM